MNTPPISNRWVQLTIAAMLIIGAGAAFAAQESPEMQMPSKQMRDKMAVIHDNMAACLRSDKPFSDCRDEMQQSCKAAMGDQGCPMMGMGMHHRAKDAH